MIDHLLGSPSPSWKRSQVFIVIIFWLWRILHGNPNGPSILWMRRANRVLKRFTPWQLVVSTLTGVYAVRHLDKILGLGSPEPLANLYSPSYYRATWIITGLDAGFATAMTIRPKWLKDLCSVLFSIYYIIYATEADEKVRKFRAVPTVEMLRTTWEKTTNPYIRAITHLPKVTIRRRLFLPRPGDSTYTRPIVAWLFFAPPEHHLARATDLILDFPGGGFISMTPEHHEDRLRMWAVRTGKPVLSIDYGKAPEYPYPYAIDECFDAYRVLVETGGQLIGMSGAKFNVVFSGDSAGAHIAVNVMLKILETQIVVPHPVALMLNYATLDFNFTSWMSPENLRVLRTEQSTGHLRGLVEQKDHLGHISPLSMVGDRKLRRRKSWRDTIRNLGSPTAERPSSGRPHRASVSVKAAKAEARAHRDRSAVEEPGDVADVEDDAATVVPTREEEKPLQARVRFQFDDQAALDGPKEEAERTAEAAAAQLPAAAAQNVPLGTRLTMTSRTGYFQDRIISPSMMRSMAILYIGPHRNPEFATDYRISPILAPSGLLAQFPPLLMTCGEKDPFVDDTVIFAGRVREAKRARREELEVALAGPAARFGEHLRMSVRDADTDEALRALRREGEVLAGQGDEDWVQMQIYSDWSHGYLQMPMLMREAGDVLYDLGDWIDEAFAKREGAAAAAATRHEGANGSAGTKRGSPVRRELKVHVPNGEGAVSASETETDDLLTFSPKKRSSPPSSVHELEERTKAGRTGSPAAGARKPHSPHRGDGAGMEGGVREGTPTQRIDLSGAGTPGKAGQTISESELMRRRRLLDAHLVTFTDAVK
ncbi:Alpha/Beta hydrolase protein [Sparassis latifolia]